MGVQQATVELVRALVLDGDSGPEVVATLAEQAKRGFARLDVGLRDYGER